MTIIKLGDVAIEAKSSNKGDKTGCKIVGLEHLTPSDVTLSAWSDDTNNSFTKEFSRGDVLFGRRRAYLKKAAVAPFDGICSGDITVIRAKEGKVDPQLLPFIIQNDYLFEFAVGKSAGSLSPRVKWEHLKNFEITLPDMKKQKMLADTLWSINQTKQAYIALINQTDELVKSQFIEMFGDPNEPTNPVPFEHAFTIRDDLRKPINDTVRADMHEDAEYPYYGANGQVDTINEYLMDCTALCLAEDCGSYGPGEKTAYIVYGKSWVNNHAHVLLPKENCNIRYANAFFRVLDMSTYVSGTTRLKLTQGKMKEIPIVLPDIELQRQFADFVDQSDKSKFELQDAIDNLDALSKKIIAENLIASGKE